MNKLVIKSLLAITLIGGVSSFAADDATPGETKASVAAKKVDESKLSPLSSKVVRLVQAGIDEKVIVAYAKQNAQSKSLGADELLYLHELGVSAPVLTAMLAEPKKAETTQASVPVASPSEKVEVTSNYAPLPGGPQPAQVNGSTVISSPAVAPVVVTQPAQPTVVYTQPTPVIVETPPVYYDSRPSISFGFGFGHFGHHGYGHGHHSIFRHGHHGGHFGGHHGGHHGHRGRHH